MSEPDDYDRWVTYHSTLFGFEKDRDLAMLDAWGSLFRGAGYKPAELFEASNQLALNAPPKWRSEHLAAIQDRIKARRIEAMAAAAKEELSWPSCEICGGCGMAIVPLLRFVQDGKWISWQTCAVFCRCVRGQREFGHCQAAKKRTLTLAEYESRNPDWFVQVEERRQMELAQAKARDQTAAADRTYGPLLRKLAATVAVNEALGG